MPVDVHRSATDELQATHAAPPIPQRAADGGSHVGPLQQPVGHVAALQELHTPPEHVPPSSHCPQGAPAVPQAAGSVPPFMQVRPSQQPVGHDSGVHTHCPLTHCRYGPHAALLPHWHRPQAHRSAVNEEQATHVVPHAEKDWHRPPSGQSIPASAPPADSGTTTWTSSPRLIVVEL